MKPFAILYLLLALTTPAAGQPDSVGERLIQKKCGVERVALPLGKYGHDFPDLFQQISMIDARPDTSRIGIVRTGRRGQNEVMFILPVSQQLTGYLNATYSRPAGRYQLLIVLKDLWIAVPDSFDIRARLEWNVRFRVEVYVKANDRYAPLMRFDSTVTGLRGEVASSIATDQVRELFDFFMRQVAATDLDKDRRLVSYQQIDSFNRAQFAYPMDNATRLVKGVYVTFDEFRDNAPSILNYTIDKDPLGKPQLNVPGENGRMTFNHTAWGYCDGHQVYVMMDGDLFTVFAVGHQFYVLGSREYSHKATSTGIGPGAPGGVIIGTAAALSAPAGDVVGKTTRTLRIFRLDPVTGRVTE
ncbi:MAG TPA: hypothetical protein VG101_19390 [Puia sp.]|jgi:hypothetical protein|nr:hypothetical protein [Puia sp.]